MVFSYIDPMSGSILLQVVIAAVIGCVAYFRRSVWQITCFVFRIKRSNDSSSE